MNGKGGGNDVYGCMLWLAIKLPTGCCCNKGGNDCLIDSFFFVAILVGSLGVLDPSILKPLIVTIVTEFYCLAFFARPAAHSTIPAS